MFDIWDKFVVELAKREDIALNFSLLSKQHDHNVIPYMSERIDGSALVDIICCVTDFLLFNEDTPNHINNDFIINNHCAYFVNPLDPKNIQQAYEKTSSKKVPEFNSIGIIAYDHSLFKNNKPIEEVKISDEHHSIKFFKKLIKIAITKGASDIHISPRNKTHIYFRFRIYGTLVFDLIDDLPIEQYRYLANQITTLAKGEAGNFGVILDGKFNFIDDGIDSSNRISRMPTEFIFNNKTIVPRFVIRVHDNLINQIKSLDGLGLNKYTYQKILLLSKFNVGLIIVTGPTGSGKTTLLYALLNHINNTKRGKSIQTLENPIEVILPNIDQAAINEDAGLNYKAGLKAFLRQDIDCGLIGEIRDEVTAKKVVELAMTGHLALTTLHANTSLGSVSRLNGLGVSDRDIADVLKAVIATRLVRRLCNACSISQSTHHEKYLSYQSLITDTQTVLTEGQGCKKCRFTGFNGRLLVAEVFDINLKAQNMIINQRANAEIEQYLIKSGASSMWHHGIDLMCQGKTSLDELESVLPIMAFNLKGE